MAAKGSRSAPTYLEPAARPTQRPSLSAPRAVGSSNKRISAASASTMKAARKISSLKKRACTLTSGVAAVIAAAASAATSGKTNLPN
jgi:hypothetical protein